MLKALKIVKDIEERLQGKYHKVKGLPLSVEGHVHALIKVQQAVAKNASVYILSYRLPQMKTIYVACM